MSADKLKTGERGIIKEILHEGLQRRRMYDFGFLPEVEISVYQKIRGNIAFNVKGSNIVIRIEDAKNIILK